MFGSPDKRLLKVTSSRQRNPLILILAILFSGTAQISPAWPSEAAATDPQLFQDMFSGGEISEQWIEPAARDELTTAMLADIVARLTSNGGSYLKAEKSARGWNLYFQNGQARARIVRAGNGQLIGVFFSKIK